MIIQTAHIHNNAYKGLKVGKILYLKMYKECIFSQFRLQKG